MSEFEPFEPVCAVRMYPEACQDELVDQTLRPRKYQLRAFVEWYEESGVGDLAELDGWDLYEFCVWKREGNFGVENGEAPEEIVSITLKSQFTTLWAFLRPVANIHTIPEDFYERTPLPKLSGMDDVNDSILEPDRTTDTLEYFHRYHYTSRRYVEFALLWEAGVRTGTICGFNLHGLDLDGRMPVARHRHRPDQGTPIENSEEGERFNSVSDQMNAMLQVYIDGPRVDKTDGFGRKPLLMTFRGWASANMT